MNDPAQPSQEEFKNFYRQIEEDKIDRKETSHFIEGIFDGDRIFPSIDTLLNSDNSVAQNLNKKTRRSTIELSEFPIPLKLGRLVYQIVPQETGVYAISPTGDALWLGLTREQVKARLKNLRLEHHLRPYRDKSEDCEAR